MLQQKLTDAFDTCAHFIQQRQRRLRSSAFIIDLHANLSTIREKQWRLDTKLYRQNTLLPTGPAQ